MHKHTLTTELWLASPLEEVFAFFSDAYNLDWLTPPWLHFRVLTPPPIEMRAGALIDYLMRWRWLPVRWQTEITVWEPPRRFVDVQRRGPYRLWSHVHEFAERDGGTAIFDRAEYAVPGGPLGPLLHRCLVRPDLERIFAYRGRRLAEKFGKVGKSR